MIDQCPVLTTGRAHGNWFLRTRFFVTPRREITSVISRSLAHHVVGGPLLGLNGVAIVGHGRSRARSVTAAIDLARVSLERGLIDSMKRELADVRSNVKGHEEM